ncbi:MAG: permease-like cell division protein FtsX [Clostridia bacterium]|mgnify:CR=1 FL=1|nr:permease-like cell division protein FtsX [Clostridia bacterium]
MKGASVGYLTREGFRNIWVNRLLSLATIVVLVSCLVIVGSGALIFLNISSVLDLIEDQNVVMVYIEDNADETAMDTLKVQLLALDNVSDVQFVSREEAFERQKAAYGDKASLLDGLTADILPNAYKVTVKDIEQFDSTVATIKQLENVLQIHENSELAGKLASIRNAVSYISLGVIAILFFVSMFIVANTIRITIFNRRLEISIMKAVGATNSFIRWPFMVEGILLGLFSAVLALGIEYGVYSVASIWLSDVMSMLGGDVVSFNEYIWYIFGIFVFIGVFIGAFGSILSLNKYLKEHNNVVENQ